MAAVRKLLKFDAYDPDKPHLIGVLEAYPWPALRWLLLWQLLHLSTNQNGSREQRKKISEIRRKLTKVAELNGAAWRLKPEGGEVLIVQSEKDLLQDLLERFIKTAGVDVDLTLDLEDFLAEAPDRSAE